MNQLVVLVATHFSRAELIKEQLLASGVDCLTSSSFKLGEQQKSVSISTLAELDELEAKFSNNGDNVEIFSYFVTDKKINLVRNGLESTTIDNDVLASQMLDLIENQIYWASTRPSRFNAILRGVTAEKAVTMANSIVDDLEHAIHVDSFNCCLGDVA